jgi:hypothetical protein
MACTKQQLRERLIRGLGGSMLKIELCIEDLDDAIMMARDYYITWAVGNATQEVYFLLMLEGGKYIYDLPIGLTEVVQYHDHFGGFGMSGYDGAYCGYNPLWYTGPEQGNTSFFAQSDPFRMGIGYTGGAGFGMSDGSMAGTPYTFVDMYTSRMYISMIHNFRANKYLWRYHRSTNQLELHPTPECGDSLTITSPSGDVYNSPSAAYPCPSGAYEDNTYDSPGYVLIRGFMIEGSSLPTYTPCPSGDIQCSMYPDVSTEVCEWLYSHPWIYKYALAILKQRLGLVRRKYANSSVMGGASISLDGDSLVSEGQQEQERLEEEIDTKYSYEGYGIYIG